MGIYGEEHAIFQQSIRRFVEQEISPVVDAWEMNHDFPSEIFTKLGDQGLLGLLVPEADGGIGGDYALAAAWCEEFGRIPAVGFTTGVGMHALIVTPALSKFGSPEAKQLFLEKAIAGTAIGAYAFTEPGAGSDLTLVQTRAAKADGGYVLNGAKTFITNGARAQFVMVLAKTDPVAGYDGFTTFVVDTSSPGFQVARRLSKIGWHSSDTAELVFTDLFVPDAMVLGQVGRGWYQAMSSLEWERLMLTLLAVGGASQCLQETVPYINSRKVFGKTVGEFDLTRDVLAGLSARLNAARALAHYGIELLLEGKPCRKEVSMAKLFGCELAIEIADRCLQLHGGYGYTTEFRPERWLRDLRLNTIGGGTSQIMARIAGREMFGK